jgi:hypothetical protein
VLLSDERFADFVDESVIPSWENVRNPIQVTLDMGDGRTERRTIGGNTVLYVVARDGTVADAFPGVYRPEEILPLLKDSVAVAMRPAEERSRFHNRAVVRESARINTGKSFVESPVLNAIGEGNITEIPTITGAVDLSHLARSNEGTRRELGIGANLPDEVAAAEAVLLDSLNNVRALRPMVHEMLKGVPRTPDQLKLPLFKDILGVPIDDPNLGIGTVVTPGGR